jgi:hypothetical protein
MMVLGIPAAAKDIVTARVIHHADADAATNYLSFINGTVIAADAGWTAY